MKISSISIRIKVALQKACKPNHIESVHPVTAGHVLYGILKRHLAIDYYISPAKDL